MSWKWITLTLTAGVLSTIGFYWVLTPALPTAKISRIVDGDTFYIVFLSNSTTEKVRIWGIDTPEECFTNACLTRDCDFG
jgi:endonuclease YncB( thermonuclease family)